MILASFNILHYKNYEETMRCVDSLLKLRGIDKCLILIYDNGSGDGSDDILWNKYNKYKNIKVIVNPEADGFSRGNNKAYAIAKKYDPRFIIAANNDIVIKQKDFLYRLLQVSKKDRYYIIGPDIYAPTVAEHQSPLYAEYPTAAHVEADMAVVRGRIEDIDEGVKWETNRLKKNRIKKYLPKQAIEAVRYFTGNKKMEDWKKEIENPVFSGSFLIVTNHFIRENDILFQPETRFYFEELLLAGRCREKGYKTLYTPKLRINHMHGASTLKAYNDIRNYLEFKYTNMLDSYEIYKKEEERRNDSSSDGNI